MEVTNVSIFRYKTVEEAIHETIKETFNQEYSLDLINRLQIEGYVGTASHIISNGVKDTYFVVTELPQCFIRVEICHEILKRGLE